MRQAWSEIVEWSQHRCAVAWNEKMRGMCKTSLIDFPLIMYVLDVGSEAHLILALSSLIVRGILSQGNGNSIYIKYKVVCKTQQWYRLKSCMCTCIFYTIIILLIQAALVHIYEPVQSGVAKVLLCRQCDLFISSFTNPFTSTSER